MLLAAHFRSDSPWFSQRRTWQMQDADGFGYVWFVLSVDTPLKILDTQVDLSLCLSARRVRS